MAASKRSERGSEEPALAEIDFYAGAYGPSILILLTAEKSVAWLHSIFESIAASSPGSGLDFARLPEVHTSATLSSLVLSKTSQTSYKHLKREATGEFRWRCTTDEWTTMGLMLEPFEKHEAGHQYLTDEGIDDALVEVSYGEVHLKQPPTPFDA